VDKANQDVIPHPLTITNFQWLLPGDFLQGKFYTKKDDFGRWTQTKRPLNEKPNAADIFQLIKSYEDILNVTVNEQNLFNKCSNNDLLLKNSTCDGQVDCIDFSDEINCYKDMETDCNFFSIQKFGDHDLDHGSSRFS